MKDNVVSLFENNFNLCIKEWIYDLFTAHINKLEHSKYNGSQQSEETESCKLALMKPVIFKNMVGNQASLCWSR